MKASYLVALSAAMAVLALLPAADAGAQSRPMPGGPRNNFHSPSHHFSWERGHGFHGGFGNVWIVEQQVPVVVEREVVREVPVAVQPVAPAAPRKPYVIGNSYASLPAGCMKMIEDGASYYFCGGGEWYKQTGKLYRAVEKKP
jgi:hypothetical protein